MTLHLLVILLLAKTGYGLTPPGRGMGLAMKICDDVVAMNLSFWYDWQYFYPCSTNISIPWIPMIFKASDVEYAKTFKGTNFEAILGFNEPNAKNQANMTVNESLALWPQLMDVGLPLCSPAPTREGATTWLAQFMEGVKQNNYRVDYLCFHFYSHPGETTMDPFLEWLDDVNSTYPEYYGKIWITEFGNNTNSTQGNIQFYKNVYDILSNGKYEGMVSRYSWFTNRWGAKPDYGWDLINSQGKPTELGKIYASHPK